MESIQFKKEFGMEHQKKKAHSFLPFAFTAVVLLCGLCRNIVSAERRINPRCNGSIAECQEEVELFMDSDVHARLLAQEVKHITPGAIATDGAVCSNGNGQPYDCSAKASGTSMNLSVLMYNNKERGQECVIAPWDCWYVNGSVLTSSTDGSVPKSRLLEVPCVVGSGFERKAKIQIHN